MKVKLLQKTNGTNDYEDRSVEELIVYIARVSTSKTDLEKFDTPEKLINYCIKNNHWSIFEHGYLTFEVETSKAIAIQMLRHRSNTFQEFSQRYQDVNKVSENSMYEDIEFRFQAETNRQSSTDVVGTISFDRNEISFPHPMGQENTELQDNLLLCQWLEDVKDVFGTLQNLYDRGLDLGIAKESVRFILPMATKTKLYVTMNVRSVIHWLDLRDDHHAQKEIQLIAKEVKKIVIKELPIISKARGYTTN